MIICSPQTQSFPPSAVDIGLLFWKNNFDRPKARGPFAPQGSLDFVQSRYMVAIRTPLNQGYQAIAYIKLKRASWTSFNQNLSNFNCSKLLKIRTDIVQCYMYFAHTATQPYQTNWQSDNLRRPLVCGGPGHVPRVPRGKSGTDYIHA